MPIDPISYALAKRALRKPVGARKLSELEIDVDKDWLGYIIKNLGGIQIPRTADPETLLEGLIWYRKDLKEWKYSPDGSQIKTLWYEPVGKAPNASDTVRQSQDAEKTIDFSDTGTKLGASMTIPSEYKYGSIKIYVEAYAELNPDLDKIIIKHNGVTILEKTLTGSWASYSTVRYGVKGGDTIAVYFSVSGAPEHIHMRNFRLMYDDIMTYL